MKLEAASNVFNNNHPYYTTLKSALQAMISRETSKKESSQFNFRNAIERLRTVSPENLDIMGNVDYIKQIKPANSDELNTFIECVITKVKNAQEENPAQTIKLESAPIIKAIYYSLAQAFEHLDEQEQENIVNNVLETPNTSSLNQ